MPIYEYQCRTPGCGEKTERFQCTTAEERVEIEGKEPGSYVLLGACPKCKGDMEMVMPHTGRPVVK